MSWGCIGESACARQAESCAMGGRNNVGRKMVSSAETNTEDESHVGDNCAQQCGATIKELLLANDVDATTTTARIQEEPVSKRTRSAFQMDGDDKAP